MDYYGVFHYTTLKKLIEFLGQPETVYNREYQWKLKNNQFIIHCYPNEIICEYEDRIHFWITHNRQDLDEALLLSKQLQELR